MPRRGAAAALFLLSTAAVVQGLGASRRSGAAGGGRRRAVGGGRAAPRATAGRGATCAARAPRPSARGQPAARTNRCSHAPPGRAPTRAAADLRLLDLDSLGADAARSPATFLFLNLKLVRVPPGPLACRAAVKLAGLPVGNAAPSHSQPAGLGARRQPAPLPHPAAAARAGRARGRRNRGGGRARDPGAHRP
jgi:hypothetical protein